LLFLCADEKELIIGELANIIKDQSYRMRNNLRDREDVYPAMPRNRLAADGERPFTYDLASDLPQVNTGDQEVPFAVLPNDRRYYQSGTPQSVVRSYTFSPVFPSRFF
jgi:hypothetical protein